jgi:hypothetical protein
MCGRYLYQPGKVIIIQAIPTSLNPGSDNWEAGSTSHDSKRIVMNLKLFPLFLIIPNIP